MRIHSAFLNRVEAEGLVDRSLTEAIAASGLNVVQATRRGWLEAADARSMWERDVAGLDRPIDGRAVRALSLRGGQSNSTNNMCFIFARCLREKHWRQCAGPLRASRVPRALTGTALAKALTSGSRSVRARRVRGKEGDGVCIATTCLHDATCGSHHRLLLPTQAW